MIHFIFKSVWFFLWHVLDLGLWLKIAFYIFASFLMISSLFKMLFRAKDILYPLLSVATDLSAKYGKGSWAVITGASDGIGKAFAFELASRGFNVVLVGRNREKLEGVERELKAEHQATQTRIIVEDLTSSSRDQFPEQMLQQVKDLDVSFVVNNAGKAIVEDYKKIPLNDIRDLVMVNALAPALITRAFLPLLAQRKRSALITVSSISADQPRIKSHLYGATKAFVDYLSRGLKDEHSNIDFLSLKPAYVSTKMTNHKEVGAGVITPESCVRSTLRALGHTDSTYGNWRHSIEAHFLHQVPTVIKRKFKL